MLPTAVYPVVLAPNGASRLFVAGAYFKIISATGAVTVEFDSGVMRGLIAGQGLQETPFSSLMFTDESGAANTLSVIVGDRNFVDSRVTGSVTFSPLAADFTNAAATVTNASGQLLAANATRQYLLIQNNDAAGYVYVRLDGGVATAATGIRLAPNGGSLELQTMVPAGAITAIGSIANNPNVLIVES